MESNEELISLLVQLHRRDGRRDGRALRGG